MCLNDLISLTYCSFLKGRKEGAKEGGGLKLNSHMVCNTILDTEESILIRED